MTRCQIGLSIVLMVCLAGCSDSPVKLAKTRSELEKSTAEVQSLQSELANSKAESKRLQAELEKAKAEAKSFQSALEKTNKNSELEIILAVADNFLDERSASPQRHGVNVRGTRTKAFLESAAKGGTYYTFRKWSIDPEVKELSAHEVSLHGTLEATVRTSWGTAGTTSNSVSTPFHGTVSWIIRLVKVGDPAEWQVDGIVYKEPMSP